MPNIAAIFKREITRLGRRQVRDETLGLKKPIAPYRSEIAALKKRTHALEQQIKRLGKGMSKVHAPTDVESDKATDQVAQRMSYLRQLINQEDLRSLLKCD